jgi:polyisoprenoid-binding protein YceI
MPERTSYGPDDAKLVVKTYREGVAAKAGHDLVIEVTRWSATVEDGAVTVEADPRSLEVREGVRGVKPLTDRDRGEIRKTIEQKVLGTQPITFTGRASEGEAGAVELDGELTMAGATRPLRARLQSEAGRVGGTISVTQSEWGIKPYRGLMGALKVRDDVEVVIDAPAP